jgi:hypothetical protein
MHLNHTMLPLHVVRSSSSRSAPTSFLRNFTASTANARSPSLADVTPEGVTTFDQKQKEFRSKLSELQKKKDASQFRTASSPVQSTPNAPSASNESSLNPGTAGSLSYSTTEPAISTANNAIEEDGGKRKGKLSSLIYGTKEGREMDQEIEQSFSQVLARGKYVHSIVFHEVKPDKVDEYVELVGNWYPKMASMPENKVHLVGSWRTEVGDCDTFGT